jgi:hypothetical protein
MEAMPELGATAAGKCEACRVETPRIYYRDNFRTVELRLSLGLGFWAML